LYQFVSIWNSADLLHAWPNGRWDQTQAGFRIRGGRFQLMLALLKPFEKPCPPQEMETWGSGEYRFLLNGFLILQRSWNKTIACDWHCKDIYTIGLRSLHSDLLNRPGKNNEPANLLITVAHDLLSCFSRVNKSPTIEATSCWNYIASIGLGWIYGQNDPRNTYMLKRNKQTNHNNPTSNI